MQLLTDLWSSHKACRKINTMVNNISDLLHALGKMNFFSKGEILALDDAETDCTLTVCSRLMLSGLRHIDERSKVQAGDYMYYDVQKTRPKCKF